MKTDRELLELAARAAGMDGWWESAYLSFILRAGGPWRPLTDDGDALRLAVRLKIHPQTFTGYTIAQYRPDEDFDWLDLEELGDDPYAATRRAITRAAAAIGESLP
jgi:hypothetical protein